MIDVNKITSTLAKLQDPQLQQYAQMHKNDPYIMALAMSESNRRKELRAASQGAQGMQEQPKVVDREIARMGDMEGASPAQLAQMLEARKQAEYEEFTGGRQAQPMPEDQGIGQLPAGDMNFAGGGIIAFADGGDVERYQSGGMSFIDRLTYGNITPAERARREKLQAEANAGRLPTPYEQERAANMAKVTAGSTYTPEAYGVTTPAPLEQGARYPGAMPAAPAAPAVDNKAAPTADTGRKAPGAGLGAAAAAAAAAPKDDPFSMASIRKAQTEAMGDSNYKIGELNNQLVDIRNKAETQVQQRLADRKKEIEAEGDVYKDRSDRLAERGKALAGQKDQNTGLALLNAGLAIMSTPGGLATAIGKGAQVGTAQYAAGIKDLRAAQERLDEANDRISELRMNRKDLNSREIRALEKDRDAAILDGQKMVFGFAKDVYGMDRKQAEAAFSSYMSGQEKKSEIQSRERIAGMQEGGANARSAAQIAASLNTPDRALWDQLMKKNGNDATKALEEFKLAKGDKFDVRPLYAEHIKEAAKTGLPVESLATYAGRFGATLPR